MAKLLETGERLEHWLVLDRFLGSWGVVYVLRELEHDESLARPAVVIAKTLRPELIDEPHRLEQFERECYTWLSLGIYKHIVRLYTVDRSRSVPYAIGEYIPEKLLPNTLRGWLDAQIVEIEAALRFGVQICRALAYAHACGVLVHQDLKPENVMITPSGVAKITDWGLSRLASKAASETTTIGEVPFAPKDDGSRDGGLLYGTPGYAAPELTRPGTVPSQQTDIYSLGVMLVEMLSGTRSQPAALDGGLRGSLAALLPENGSRLVEILSASLETEPKRRPGSPEAVEAVLNEAFAEVTGVPVEARPARQADRSSDLGQRAYALFMLGRTEEAMKLQRQLLPADKETGDQPSGPLGVLMDYKEHGWKSILSKEIVEQAEEKARQAADPQELDGPILTHTETGNYPRALALCEEWMRRQPEDPKPYQRAAYVQQKRGRLSEALAFLDKATDLAPADADLWLEKAKLSEAQGDLPQAMQSVRMALDVEPDKVESHLMLGHYLAQSGDPEAALDVFDKAVSLDPENALGWYDQGTIWKKLGKRSRALESFHKAVECDPRFSLALNSLAGIYGEIGAFQEAITYLERAIDVEPFYARPWFNKAQIYEHLGKVDLARQALQTALEIDPAYDLARQALRELERKHRL